MTQNNEMPSHHGSDDQISADYPNETLRLLIERSSCRSFHDKKIPDSIMKLLFEAPRGRGHYFGSDGLRSPMDRYRAPGSPEYTGS